MFTHNFKFPPCVHSRVRRLCIVTNITDSYFITRKHPTPSSPVLIHVIHLDHMHYISKDPYHGKESRKFQRAPKTTIWRLVIAAFMLSSFVEQRLPSGALLWCDSWNSPGPKHRKLQLGLAGAISPPPDPHIELLLLPSHHRYLTLSAHPSMH